MSVMASGATTSAVNYMISLQMIDKQRKAFFHVFLAIFRKQRRKRRLRHQLEVDVISVVLLVASSGHVAVS